MAFTSATAVVASGAAAMWELFQLLLANGATCLMSGDGLALYSSSGNVFTGSGTGPGGWGNPRAWAVVRVDGTEDWCLQRSLITGDADDYRIAISLVGGFAGGSATVCAASPSEGWFLGGGTPTSPSYANLFGIASRVITANACFGCDDASPRRFYLMAYQTGGAPNIAGCLFRDVLTGTPDTGDAGNVVRGFQRYIATNIDAWLSTNGGPTNDYYYLVTPPALSITGLSSFGHCPMTSWSYNAVRSFPANVGALAISGYDPLCPPCYARGSAFALPNAGCIKGWSTLLAFMGISRPNGSGFNLSGANERIGYNGITFPWNGTTPPA